MKTKGFAVIGTLLVTAACAHGNGASGSAQAVRMTSNQQEVASCERVAEVRVSGSWTKNGGRSELQKLAGTKGANVLLIADESRDSGVAYRCSGSASAASQK